MQMKIEINEKIIYVDIHFFLLSLIYSLIHHAKLSLVFFFVNETNEKDFSIDLFLILNKYKK